MLHRPIFVLEDALLALPVSTAILAETRRWMDLRGDVTGAPRELGPHPVLLASGTREEMRMSRERREGEARPPHGCGSSGTWLKTWPPLTLCGSIPLRLLRNYFRQCPRPRFFGDFGTHVMATLCGPICRLGCGTTRSTFYFSVTISFSFLFPRELGL